MVRTRFVVEADLLVDDAPEVILAEDEHVVEHLSAKRIGEAFSEGIHIRRAYRRAHHAHPRRSENVSEPRAELRIMIADAGWMSRVASRQAGATPAARTIMKRCQRVHRTRPATFRSAAMSCCRRSAFSATSSARRRVRSTASPKTNRRRSSTCRVLHRPRAGWNL